MPIQMQAEVTSFTLDNPGRYLCNTLQEALYSAGVPVAGQAALKNGRPFDVIIVGGGTFGCVVAQHILSNDVTRSRRILVLEQGPLVLQEHEQNTPFVGGASPPLREPWVSDLASLNNGRHGGFSGLLFAIGGRSLIWGGWSPEPLQAELGSWPPAVVAALRNVYYQQSSDQIGVTDINDYIYGPLQNAMRQRLFDGLTGGTPGAVPFAALLDHPAVRFRSPALPPLTAADLRALLGLDPASGHSRADLLNMLKLEAPLAVQARTQPGLFSVNKFSGIPLLIRSARLASRDSYPYDELKRLMVVDKCHVIELVTQTLPNNDVEVLGVRVANNPYSDYIPLASGGVVIVSLGTIESTRLALLTFKDSLGWRAAQRIGQNLIAHLRSNVVLRVPLGALGNPLAGAAIPTVPVSALFAKGSANLGGRDHFFHVQITASAGTASATDPEADLFQKVPDLDQVEHMREATATSVVIALRGIGEMAGQNASSRVQLATNDWDPSPPDAAARPAAWVTVGDARALAEGTGGNQVTPVTNETRLDAQLWEKMDSFMDELAVIFANGGPFEILPPRQNPIAVPAAATAADVARLYPHLGTARRDFLGTTHHEAGTLWMGANVASSVTDGYGKLHDTTNCFFAGPSVFPSLGSPNPMLTGVALGRRTADFLSRRLNPPEIPPATLLPSPAPFRGDDPTWQVLFDGTFDSFQRWRRAGSSAGGGGEPPCDFRYSDGQIVTVGKGDHAILYYPQSFANFILKLQIQIFDAAFHNSGVFVRFQNPLLDLQGELARRAAQDLPALGIDWRSNRAWTAVYSGFEVQVDDNAKPNPPGLRKHRTGAIYNISAGDPGEPALQQYQPAPAMMERVWYEFEIRVQGQQYEVLFARGDAAVKARTTLFNNQDQVRGLPAAANVDSGYVGIQAHYDGRVAVRNVQIKVT